MIKYLIELDSKVPLKELVSKGLIEWSIIRNRDIYLFFDSLLITGKEKKEAYEKTAKEWKMSKRSIERIVKYMKDAS